MLGRLLIALVLGTLAIPTGDGRATPCTLAVTPQVSQAPLRYLRLTTHLDDPPHWWAGTLFLVDDDGEIARSQLFEGDMAQHEPKTRVTEWKTLVLEEGEYEVQFIVVTRDGERCEVAQRVEVHE